MLEHRISCLPVLSEDGGIEGIVTWKDMLMAFVETDEVLCKVCRMRLSVRQRYSESS
jgi:CBS-domain-containing membrane protein